MNDTATPDPPAPAQIPAVGPPPAAAAAPAPAAPASGVWVRFAGVLALVLAVVALLLAAWHWHETRGAIEALRQELARKLAEADTLNKAAKLLADQAKETSTDALVKLGVLESQAVGIAEPADRARSAVPGAFTRSRRMGVRGNRADAAHRESAASTRRKREIGADRAPECRRAPPAPGSPAAHRVAQGDQSRHRSPEGTALRGQCGNQCETGQRRRGGGRIAPRHGSAAAAIAFGRTAGGSAGPHMAEVRRARPGRN